MSQRNTPHFSSIHSSMSSFRPTFISPSRRHTTLSRSSAHAPSRRTPSTSSGNTIHSQTPKHSLEECIHEIESILQDPGISTLLNQNQSEAIGSLREAICQCYQNSIYLENDINGSYCSSSSTIPAGVLDNLHNPNCGFLACNYGGLRLSECTTATTSGVIDDNSIAKKDEDGPSHSSSLVDDHSLQMYIPQEWESLSDAFKVELAEILTLKNLDTWDFNILDVVKNVDPGSVLVLVGWAIMASPDSQKVMMSSVGKEYSEGGEWDGYNFSSCLGVDYKTLCDFLRALESQYDITGKYHNNIHAADVLQTFHSMIRMGSSELSHAISALDLYSMLLAAAAHDVGHPGTNNIYQINANTNLAMVYNDMSPLENMHASKSSQIMKQLGLFDNFTSEQQSHARSRMISAILATDMAHHFNKVSYMEEFISQFEQQDGIHWYDYVEEDPTTIQDVLNYMIHLADISNPTKMRPLALYWADCALAEFFSQGDLERSANLPISPLCDRESTNLPTSQRDFIRFVVLPSYKVLGGLFHGVAVEVLPKILDNLRYWESQCDCSAIEDKFIAEENASSSSSSSSR